MQSGDLPWPPQFEDWKKLAFYALGSGIERHRALPEVGLVGHVAGQRRVIAEDCILRHGLARFHGVEERRQMRLHIVVVVAAPNGRIGERFLTRRRVILLVPCLVPS